jgi:hypothetical protein
MFWLGSSVAAPFRFRARTIGLVVRNKVVMSCESRTPFESNRMPGDAELVEGDGWVIGQVWQLL